MAVVVCPVLDHTNLCMDAICEAALLHDQMWSCSLISLGSKLTDQARNGVSCSGKLKLNLDMMDIDRCEVVVLRAKVRLQETQANFVK